uniref:Uncharacterized protein n=1 Tax=Tanacetum cinerariifolium TaxID=118510 RepID=A0A699J871_TANCI|nr:hypothetical protein [Tanacetum cinerariifolium]
MGCDGEIDDMLRIRVREAESEEEIFTSVAWIRALNINEPIYAELCYEFYSTYECDEESHFYYQEAILRVIHKMITYGLCQRTTGLGDCKMDEEERSWNSKESQICCGQFISKLARKCRVLTEDVVRSLSAPIYCRDLDITTFRDLIDSDGKLIPEDPQLGVPRVGIPRPPRASMQDLYDRMGRMKIRQEAIEHIEYRQSYHLDRYHGVFGHMAGVYSVPLQGAYNLPSYAQPQCDQYYQQYPPPPSQYQPQYQQQ